jgi:hypothetical protein
MDVIVANTAQPEQVGWFVVSALGAEPDMVRVGARPAFAEFAGLAQMLEAVAAEGVDVYGAPGWARVAHPVTRSTASMWEQRFRAGQLHFHRPSRKTTA